MYIGEISRKTGLSIKAIRLYEERGLIRPPTRSGRYRVYTDSDIDLLLLIKEAKSLGVTLSALQTLIRYPDGQLDWHKVAEFLIQQKIRIFSEIQALNATVEKIDECLTQINRCPDFA